MNHHALVTLWNLTQQHPGTSGARAAAGVLLGLYNGRRFPLHLTDLRLMDDNHVRAAMAVIQCDAMRCEMEVHEHLNSISGRRDFGQRLEHLAHEYDIFRRGRCTRAQLQEIRPTRLLLPQFVAQESAHG